MACRAAFREAGLDGDTLVLFTSDNGGQQAARNLPCRGRKGQLREGGIRVPLLVRQPGVVPAGRVVGDPALTTDLTATALDAAGEAPQTGRPPDGIDLRPVDFRARTGEVVARALREGDWKPSCRVARPRLFDLVADVGEARDLAGRHPDIVARLVKKLGAWEQG